jgi:hypothetical protein
LISLDKKEQLKKKESDSKQRQLKLLMKKRMMMMTMVMLERMVMPHPKNQARKMGKQKKMQVKK